MKLFTIAFITLLFSSHLFSQGLQKQPTKINQGNSALTFYSIQKLFNDYWSSKGQKKGSNVDEKVKMAGRLGGAFINGGSGTGKIG